MPEKSKTPAIRFKGFNDDWEQRKLGDEVQITMGQSPDGNFYTDIPSDCILVQGNADIKNGWVMPRVWTSQVTKKAETGDLIMSVRAPAGEMGKTAYNAAIGRGVAAIKGNEFIFQSLVKMNLEGYWKRLSCGSTFESLNSDNIKNAEIMIPHLNEQVQIGAFFSNLDNLITLHQRKLLKLKNVKKAMLEKMFPKNGSNVPEIRFAGFTDAWEQRKLSELGKTQSGIGFSESEQGGTDGFPFFKVSDMNNPGNEHEMKTANNYVSLEQLQRWKWKPIEDVPAVIFAKVGAAIMLNRKRLVRRPFLIDNNTMAYIFNDSWDEDFGKTLFETISLPRYVQVGALPSYNGSDIEAIEVCVPAREEQTKIAELFVNLDNLITLHQRKYEKLQNLKKACLEKMFV